MRPFLVLAGGFCPGPAFTALETGANQAIYFVFAMLVGMVGARMIALKNIAATAPNPKN